MPGPVTARGRSPRPDRARRNRTTLPFDAPIRLDLRAIMAPSWPAIPHAITAALRECREMPFRILGVRA